MAVPSLPEPVKYFVAILWSDSTAVAEAYARLTERWGAIDLEGPDRRFDLTDYYEADMGSNLARRLVSFHDLRAPDELAQAKLDCIAIEGQLAGPRGRRVNLDIGYLDHNKIVLASIKAAGQKIYLAHGVYADLVARYAHRRYEPFPWTFPDFKDGRYDEELVVLRERWLQQIKAWRISRHS